MKRLHVMMGFLVTLIVIAIIVTAVMLTRPKKPHDLQSPDTSNTATVTVLGNNSVITSSTNTSNVGLITSSTSVSNSGSVTATNAVAGSNVVSVVSVQPS